MQTVGSSGSCLRNQDILDISADKDASVMSEWPEVDFFLFQEVWDRYNASAIAEALSEKIGDRKQMCKYFIQDVARQDLWNNFCTGSKTLVIVFKCTSCKPRNSFFSGSGLMICSRYPLEEISFVPFENKKSWQRFISYGALMAKVRLGDRKVGYLMNLHTMAYQEKENQIGVALEKAQEAFESFQEAHKVKGEKVAFAVIGGDFNFDNISPGKKEN